MKNEEVYENNSRAPFIDKSPLFALLSNKINYVVDFERREHLGRFSAMNQRESSKKILFGREDFKIYKISNNFIQEIFMFFISNDSVAIFPRVWCGTK